MNSINKNIWVILLIIPTIAFAQPGVNNDKDWGVLAEENPHNAYLQFQAGIKTFFSLKENRYALEYFRKACEKVSTSEYNITEARGYAPVEVYYFMAESFRRIEQPDSAMKYLLKYQHKAVSSPYDIHLTMVKAYNSSLAYRKQNNLESKTIPFNKKYHHPDNPIISLNGEKLFFTTERIRNSKEIEKTGHGNRDIVFCSRVNNEWNHDTLFIFNTKSDEYPVYTSPLGDILYFVRKDKKHTYHLYKSEFRQGKWSEPVVMPKPFNTSFGVRGFALNPNQNKALLVKEIEGVFTLFYTSKKGEKWNLPKKIDIPNIGNTLSPTFHFSDTIVYFTSNGLDYQGLGGYDIYSAQISEKGSLSNIKALIHPINHSYDTEFFTVSGNGISISSGFHQGLGSKLTEYASFSNLQMNKKQLESLVSNISVNNEVAEVLAVEKEVIKEVEKEVIEEVIEIEEVEVEKEVSVGYVDEKDAKKLDNVVRTETDTIVEYLDAEPIVEEMVVDNDETDQLNDSLNIVNNAISNFDLDQLNDSLRKHVINKVTTYISLNKKKKKVAKKEKITTTKIKVEGPNVEAENIYFNINQVNFNQDDRKRLDELAKLALQKPSINIEIVGYTDSQGDFKVNRKIALARADNIYHYLIKKGIAEKRMISYGRAFLQQASENNTKSGRKLNRRVEILLYH